MVRLEPAGTLMAPAATPLTVGMLNTNGVAMSGAVTSTTTVATLVPVSAALMKSFVWTARPSTPAGSRGRHEPSAISDSSVAVIRRRIRAPRYGATVIVAVPETPWKTAEIEVVPPPVAVTSPVPSTVATPGSRVAQATTPVVRFPLESRIAAESCTVPAIDRLADGGVTVTMNDPSVALIGRSPVRGVSTIVKAELGPDRMVTVTDPLCVSTPPASKARSVIVRFEPAGTVMLPAALPLTMGMLNTSIAGMYGAVTSATMVATIVPERLALTPSVPSPPVGPTGP